MTTTSPDHQSEQRSGPAHPAPVRWPLRVALACIGAVWLGGCVWSFEEQTDFAQSKQFRIPELLPIVIDGFAVAMAAVAWAASLDGRAAIFARTGTAIAVACSAGSNAAWAWERSSGDWLTVILAAGVPVVANVAFEVLLSEARRQVQRKRGIPAPVAIPMPRLIRTGLAPFSTLRTWRREVLEVTDPRRQFDAVRPAPTAVPQPSPRPAAKALPAPVRTNESDQPADQTNVTPITRATKRVDRKTGRRHTKQTTTPGPAAIRDANELLDEYADRLDEMPSRNELMGLKRWGAPRASNALAAIPFVQSARETRNATGDQSADDPKEQDSDLVSA